MSAIRDLNAVSGWRILLYAILGTWVIGATGAAVNNMVRGPKDLSLTLSPDGSGGPVSIKAHAPQDVPSAPKMAGVAGLGIVESDIEDLATALAGAYGPLPPEAIPAQGGIVVGGALPWIAGIVAAAAAVGVLVYKMGPGPAHVPVDVKPVEVKPVDVSVKPDLTPLAPFTNALKSVVPGQGGGSPQLPAIPQDLANQLGSFMQSVIPKG